MKKYGLSARERIKHKKDLNKIFQSGTTVLSSDKKIIAYYFVDVTTQQPVIKFAVTISKKLGNAVWRNRLKRIFRAAYRLNKSGLIDKCLINSKSVNLVFSPQRLNQENNKVLKLADIETGIREVMGFISNRI